MKRVIQVKRATQVRKATLVKRARKATHGAQLRILVVDKVQDNEENGVLYLIRKTVENLYPNQIQMSETGNGVTVTFVDKQFSVNGVCSPNDQWGWTRTFEMPLEPNKKYNVQFTLKSGSLFKYIYCQS